MKKSYIGTGVTGIVLLFVFSLFCVSCGREGRATDMKLARTEGMVEVQDEKEKEIPPAENMGLYSGYRIDTKQAGYAWIDLDRVKLAKMDQNSAVEIHRFRKALELQLRSGSIYFNIAEPLGEDESLSIRSSTMAIGIRGTIGWAELVDENQMKVGILEGKVQCAVTDPETGETVTAEVSQGETALLIHQPGNDAIVLEKIQESGLPEFVKEELREDTQAAERAEAASGMVLASGGEDSEDTPEPGQDREENTPEPDRKENSQLLQEYLDQELAPLYGYADLSPRENTYYPVDEYYTYEVDRNWTGLSGIANTRILDLDGDGSDEMLVVIVQGQQLDLEVYEIENEVPVMTGRITENRIDEVGMGDDCFYEKVLSVVESEGVRYLLFTSQFSGFVTGDGYFSYVNLYRYDGGKLYTPLTVLQSGVGSAGFRYNAFQYDENGTLLNEEIIYDGEDYENYGDAYCHERMEALFGQHGIGLGENAGMINSNGIFDAFLAPGTEYERIVTLRMTGEYLDDHVIYQFSTDYGYIVL